MRITRDLRDVPKATAAKIAARLAKSTTWEPLKFHPVEKRALSLNPWPDVHANTQHGFWGVRQEFMEALRYVCASAFSECFPCGADYAHRMIAAKRNRQRASAPTETDTCHGSGEAVRPLFDQGETVHGSVQAGRDDSEG